MRVKNPCKKQSILTSFLIVWCLFVAAGKAELACPSGCPKSDSGLLHYKPGNVYEYNFDTVMTVGLNAGSATGDTDDTSLKLVGGAKVFAKGNCNYVLQLNAVKVTATKDSTEKKIVQNIQKPIQFSLVGGKLEPVICADPNDNVYALNIKRAIVSLLQANTDIENGSEVDVFGQCPTYTSVSKVDGAEVISKVRNLNGCAYRERINSGIINGVVNSHSGIKSTLILQADYSKESTVERGVLQNVHAVEEYKFAGTPKDGGVGVRAKVLTTLKLKNPDGTPAAAPAAANARGISIIFQKPDVLTAKNIGALKAALTAIVNSIGDYVKKDSAEKFIELIRLMRNADVETLLELAAVPLPNKVLARKVYLDALFRVGTSESAQAIMKQLNKMEDKEKVIALLSLNLVQTVDRDTLNQANTLLTPAATKEVYLAVGSIVSKYCQSNDCSTAGAIDGISKKFVDNLKQCKANTKKDEDRIVYILKGIGNTHHLATAVAPTLAECASAGRPLRVRVAALQAYSAASCDSSLQQSALRLLQDRNEDSELRIEAYLAAINCPNAEISNRIAEIVNSETVNQVGGFITSSLRAIRDSTDATREYQRHFLGNIRVTKHFPKDFRRYSYNNELSYKFDALGVSASADYKLIYSQHGFLPRSGRLNVTGEIFGTNFNLFEASVRQENLENILEYYAGPKGLLNRDFEDIIKMIQESSAGVGPGGRTKRSIAEDTAKIAKKYKTYGSKNVQDLNLDLSLKLFGSEILFLSLGDNIPTTIQEVIDQFTMTYMKAKSELSSFQKEFTSHTLFMDDNIIYPTTAGIPLEIVAQGFSANKLDFGINVDVDNLLSSTWQSSQYRLKVVPSVDVSVNVQLGFNAYVLSTGVRVVSNLHSASGSDVNLSFNNDGNGFNMDIELPREKIELIEVGVNTDFYVGEQDKETKSVALKSAKKHAKGNEHSENCFNYLESLGIGFCFSTSLLSGERPDATAIETLLRPFSLSVYATSERKLNLRGYHVPQTASGTQQWKLDYSTPDSKVPHDTSLALELGVKPNTFGRVSFKNSEIHFGLEAGLTNDDKELVVYGQYELNDNIKKNKIGFTKNGNEYRPIIEVQGKDGVVNDINGYRADGRVVVQNTGDKQAKYNFENFQIVNKDTGDRVVLNGWVDLGQSSLDSELRVAPGQQSFLIKSNFKIGNGEYVAGVFVNDEKTPENVIGGSANIKLGQQMVNIALVGKGAAWEVDNGFQVEYVKADDDTALKSTKFTDELTVKHKNQLWGSFKVDGETELNSKLRLETEIVRGKKSASLAVKLFRNQKAQNDYSLEVNGKLNNHFVDVLAKCDVSGNNYVIDNTLTTSWGTSLTAKGELGQRYTPQDIHVDLYGTIQFTNKDKPYQWAVKAVGAPEKTNSELKITRESAELLKLTAETQHPQDKITQGKVNLVVKNVITAKGDFKVAKNGKGDFGVVVETLKPDQKHKIDVQSKFHVLAPKYDVETTVTVDADKKFYLKTENVVDKLKLATKNVVEAFDKKVSLDANVQAKGEWRLNGEVQGNFVFTCPEGHVIDGTFKRKVTTNAKTGIAQGTAELQLNDQQPGGGAKRTIDATAKLDKLNVKTKEFAVQLHAVYTNFDGKKLDLDYHLKHLPKGQNKMIDLGVGAKGDLLSTTPFDVSVVVDEYDLKHAVFRVNYKCGDHVTAAANGNYNLGDSSTPSTYELQGNLQVPNSKFQTFEIHSNGKYLKPNVNAADGTGSYIYELHVDEKTGENHFIKLNTLWKGTTKTGAYSVGLESNELSGPVKLDGSYQREQQGSLREGTASGKQSYAVNFSYGSKYIKSTADVSYVGPDTANLHYTLDSSFESVKDVDVEVRAQKLDADSYGVNVKAKQNENTYTVDTKIYRSTHKKGLEIHAGLPNSPPVVVVGVFEVLGERKAKWSAQVENVLDLDFTANSEASYKSVDDFYVNADWNSKKLNLINYRFVVRSQGKAITLNLQNADGVIFDGSATYVLKKEKNKAIIEGSGQLQYKGKPQNTNFKLIRQVYELAADKEIGFSYTFNGNFGGKNGVSTLKITNKDFNIKLSVCEEKKQCTNVQVQSIVTTDEQEFAASQHSVLVLIDLRELGYPYEFELQSKTNRNGFKFEYSLNSKITSNNNMKYQLIASVVPTGSKVQLVLPSREILLETQQKYPENGQVYGHYENAVSFYFDKARKPNDVSRLVAEATISGDDYVAINMKGLVKFEHPTIRPLTVSGKLDANRQQSVANAELVFDIFRVPEQQIIATSRFQNTQKPSGFNLTTTQAVTSSGLNIHYEFNGHTALNIEKREFSAAGDVNFGVEGLRSSASLFGNKEQFELQVDALNEPILRVNGHFNSKDYSGKLNTRLQAFGQAPVEFGTEVQASAAKLTVKRQGLLDATFEAKLGKEIKFNVEGAGKTLFNGQVALNAAKFLETTYNSNDEDVKNFLSIVESEIKKESEANREKIKQRSQKLRTIIEQQVKLFKDSTPDFAQLQSSYQNNINEIVKDLDNDPSLKPLIESYRKLYAKINQIAGDFIKISTEAYEKFHKSFVGLYEKFEVILKDVLLPAYEEFVLKATTVVSELRGEIIKLYTAGFQQILHVLKQYGPALKNYGKAINEALRPIQKAAEELCEVIQKLTQDLLNEITAYFAEIPTFEAISNEVKDKLQKYKLAEKTLDFVNGFFDQLHILPTTVETTELLEKVRSYIEAKLKNQPVDDRKFIEELLKLFAKAVRSAWVNFEMALSGKTGQSNLPSRSLSSLFTAVPLSIDIFTQLPAVLSLRFSFINFLINENWDAIFSKDLWRSWITYDDFNLVGHVVDGHHVFTFDNQHFSFPGSCKYILAQDSVDNNFTVIANINGGKLKSIILTDRDGSFLEATDTGLLKLNNNPVEYPVHENGVHAWRLLYTVWLRSEYGVVVTCTADLKVCHVDVDGFYTSKTRGLLGNGNAEPYDDFVQIDGTIASDYAQFGNGYGIGKCAPVANDGKSDDASKHHTEICDEFFGFESPLALGNLFIDSTPYRAACDLSVNAAAEKDKESVACTVALGYGSALKLTHKVALLPPRCLKCEGAAGQREIGQEFTTKIPNNKADLVFVVDVGVTSAVLGNLVAPAITEIRESLKARGFSDVQIGVVAYNESQRYPALLTSNNGKLNYQGNLATVQLNGPKNSYEDAVTQTVTDKKVLSVFNVIERIIKSIVPQSDELAFRLALDYPFRAGAAKSIVVVRSEAMDYGNVLQFLRAHLAGAVTKFDGALLHLIAPIPLKVEGIASEKLIGFNSRLVATLDGKDAKKRQKLQFENDIGIDFVLENGGWVFSTNSFDNLKAGEQKKALNQVTTTIADTMFKTEIVSDCRCLPVHGLHAQHKCSIKSSTFLPNKKVKAA